MDEDPRREEARRLRVDPGLSRSQLMRLFGVGNGTLSDWLQGLEAPEWTRRPRAKDDLRAQAVELRRQGCTVPQIAERLGVSKSSAFIWTRDMPLFASLEEAAAHRREHSKQVADARWAPLNKARDERRAEVNGLECARVGELSRREIILLGAVSYWCEGQKSKPWEPNRCRVTFINSDPGLILLFLRFLEVLGEDRADLKYRISIHESADVEGAGRWWADVVGVPFEQFRRPTLKTHNPLTVRYNIGDPYRGCLVVEVPRSRELYWTIEGLMRGIVGVGGKLGDARM